MSSIAYLLDDVTQLHAQLHALLSVEAEQLADQTKFNRRPAKFTGTTFAPTLVFGYLYKPDAARR